MGHRKHCGNNKTNKINIFSNTDKCWNNYCNTSKLTKMKNILNSWSESDIVLKNATSDLDKISAYFTTG